MTTLEPIIAIINSEDAELLRTLANNMPPAPINPTRKQLNGWNDQTLNIGQLISSFCQLLRNGDLTIEYGRE